MRRTLLATTALALLGGSAVAQEYNRAALEGQVTSRIIDNQAGLVTPAAVRNTLLNILNSIPTLIDNPGSGGALLSTNNIWSLPGSNNFQSPVSFAQMINPMVPQYAGGAKCDGATDDTAAFVAAEAAAINGAVVGVPAGLTCVVDQVALTSGSTFTGVGGVATIKRIANSTHAVMIVGDGTAHVKIKDLILDGGKANNTACQVDLSFFSGAYDFTVDNVTAMNAKSNGGCGDGISVQNTGDQAHNTHSRILHSKTINNDLAGIYVSYADSSSGTVFHLDIDDWYSYGSSGFQAIYNTAGDSDKIDDIKITHATVDCSGAASSNGVEFLGNVGSVGSVGNVYSNLTFASWNITLGTVTAKNCTNYGIGVQAKNGIISDAHTINSGTVVGFGGMLLNSNSVVLKNSTIDWVGTFGLDAGGCVSCLIEGLIVSPLQGETASTGAGLNVGGSINTTVSGNYVQGNGTLIDAEMVESAGPIAFPWSQTNLRVLGNTAVCTSNSCIGVGIKNGAQAYLSGNDVEGTTAANSYLINSQNVSWGARNTFNGNNGLVDVVASANALQIPEDATSIYVTGTTTINTILTYSQALYNGAVAYQGVSAGGSLYSSAPALSWTGGSCSVAPAGTAFIDGAGIVRAVRMTNNGTCSSCPTGVSATGGGGSGATFSTPQCGVPNEITGRALTFIAGGSMTITNFVGAIGQLINRSGSNISATVNQAFQYMNEFGVWYQPQ